MLESHKEGSGFCSDNEKWGHTWISVLGLERMFHALHHLRGELYKHDADLLNRVLLSEANWLAHEYFRGAVKGIQGGLWTRDGKNDPESNIWNGSFLWRITKFFPGAPAKEVWEEKALEFLATGISCETDLNSDTLWDGKPLRARCHGPNFFPNYALDHHGYFNVGYMVICLSNIAMLHFDAKQGDYETPELLHLRADGLWSAIKRMLMPDGRLIRIGGDTRVRYAYCQEYLMPTLLYAADKLRDPHALGLLANQLETISLEQSANADGSFYGSRLQWLREEDPVYYTRLESDRANALSMVVTYAKLVDPPDERKDFLESVSGAWSEPDHGDILHRSPERFTSFSWSSFQNGQGIAVPGDDGNLLEWDFNLSGRVCFPKEEPRLKQRQVGKWWMSEFEGGFLTQGTFHEGLEVFMGEQWRKKNMCAHRLVFCALPDAHTVLGLEYATTTPYPCWVKSADGLHFNLPNDLFNGNRRLIQGPIREWLLNSSNRSDEDIWIPERRVLVESRIGISGIYGGQGFRLLHQRERTGGPFKSLYTDILFYGGRGQRFLAETNACVVDCGWAIETALQPIPQSSFFAKSMPKPIFLRPEGVRGVEIAGWDNKCYRLIVNFSEKPVDIAAADLSSETRVLAGCNEMIIQPGESRLSVIAHFSLLAT